MPHPAPEDIRALVTISYLRRGFAYVVQLALGALLLYTAVAGIAGALASLFLGAFGLLALFAAERLRRATKLQIYLTDDALYDSGGTRLAAMSDIAAVNRGPFALKPSNGFVLVMKTPQTRGWAPGLWWRFGRRVGIGGVTNAGAAKFMAEQIALRLAERQS